MGRLSAGVLAVAAAVSAVAFTVQPVQAADERPPLPDATDEAFNAGASRSTTSIAPGTAPRRLALDDAAVAHAMDRARTASAQDGGTLPPGPRGWGRTGSGSPPMRTSRPRARRPCGSGTRSAGRAATTGTGPATRPTPAPSRRWCGSRPTRWGAAGPRDGRPARSRTGRTSSAPMARRERHRSVPGECGRADRRGLSPPGACHSPVRCLRRLFCEAG